MEIKVIIESEGEIDLKAKASGICHGRTVSALSGRQLTFFEIHVTQKGSVYANL